MKSALLLLSTLLLGMPQTLVPDAAVSGRVRDVRQNTLAAGLGVVPPGRVALGTLTYRDGRRTFQMTATAQADAAGNYRVFNVRPGEYYVRAESLGVQGVPTYYPGTLDIDAATRIVIAAGQEVVGLDFDIVDTPMFKVSGTIVDIPSAAATNGLPNFVLGITFASADPRYPDPNAAPLLQAGGTQANGRFEVSLPAGEWDLFPVIPIRANGPPGQPAPPTTPVYVTGRARVLLRDANVENVVIRIGSSDLNGRVVFPESSSEELAGLVMRMRIGLIPAENYPSPFITHLRTPQTPASSGEFTFKSVPPGRYEFQITSIPAGFHLADIRVGAKSVYDDGVITVGTEPLEAVNLMLFRNGAKVRATLTGRDVEEAVGGSLRRIVLVPAERRDNALLYKVTLAGDSFTLIPDVAPGRYNVFAFQELPPGGAEQDAEFMKKYHEFGVPIDVAAGQTVDVQVPWIPAAK